MAQTETAISVFQPPSGWSPGTLVWSGDDFKAKLRHNGFEVDPFFDIGHDDWGFRIECYRKENQATTKACLILLSFVDAFEWILCDTPGAAMQCVAGFEPLIRAARE